MPGEFHDLPAAPRILVFRGGALGDFLLTLPVFQALRRAWPRAELTLVGAPRIAELARLAGLVQQVLPSAAARFAAYFIRKSALPPPESEFLRSFDLVLSFWHDPDGGLRRKMSRAGARRVLSIQPRIAAGHAADYFLRILEPLGINSSPMTEPQGESGAAAGRLFSCRAVMPKADLPAVAALRAPRLQRLWRPPAALEAQRLRAGSHCGQVQAGPPGRKICSAHSEDTPLELSATFGSKNPGVNRRLSVTSPASPSERLPHGASRLDLPSDLQAAGRARLKKLGLPGPVIAIQPGSGSVKKNWPWPSFLALAAALQQTGLGRVLWIVGEAEAGLARSLQKDSPGAPVLKECGLPEVAAVLSQCRGYVGNDSGISHLAAAVGTPTVALFGPTDPDVWGPRGRQVAILRAQPPTTAGLARIGIQDVMQALFPGWAGKL
jgi:ADP-heptose:LPS heptosyltransferase